MTAHAELVICEQSIERTCLVIALIAALVVCIVNQTQQRR
jgi:hypothetical protein